MLPFFYRCLNHFELWGELDLHRKVRVCLNVAHVWVELNEVPHGLRYNCLALQSGTSPVAQHKQVPIEMAHHACFKVERWQGLPSMICEDVVECSTAICSLEHGRDLKEDGDQAPLSHHM